MPRDFWQTFRQALRVNKLNKFITLPAFSERAFRHKDSLYVTPTDPVGYALITTTYETEFSFEFWAKTTQPNTPNEVSFLDISQAAPFDLQMKFVGGNFVLDFLYSLDNFSLTLSKSPGWNTWNHFAVTITFKTGVPDGLLTVYLNGENIGTNAILSAAMPGSDTVYIFPFSIGGAALDFYGHLAEVRFWNKVLTQDEILFIKDKPIGATVYTNLIFYFPENDASVASNFTDFTYEVSSGPPLIYGGSFIVLEFPVVNDTSKFSFKYPIKKPTVDCNFCLCIRWLDADGVLQRYKFWTVGEDINPDPPIYEGQPIGTDAVIEIWNIDGNETVDLASAMTLYVSLTSNAQSSADRTNVALETLTENPTIWAAFPWTNTQTFNEANPLV